MKLAMVRADAALARAGLKDRVRLVMNVHDALEWYVRKDVPPAQVIRVLQPAVIFPVPGWPPMVAEWHCGERWGSVLKLDVALGAGGAVTGVTLARRGGAPVAPEESEGEELDDEDDVAPAPARTEAVAQVLAKARQPEPAAPAAPPPVAGGPARTVIVTVDHEITREDAEAFLERCAATLGPNRVLLRTPSGELTVSFATGLSPADTALVSVILGGATVSYDAASVDLEALAGVIEA